MKNEKQQYTYAHAGLGTKIQLVAIRAVANTRQVTEYKYQG